MEDHTYVMSFSLLFGRYFIAFSSVLSTIGIILPIKFLANSPLWLIALSSFFTFITLYWVFSGMIYFLELLYYVSSTARKILEKVDTINKEIKHTDQEIVH